MYTQNFIQKEIEPHVKLLLDMFFEWYKKLCECSIQWKKKPTIVLNRLVTAKICF